MSNTNNNLQTQTSNALHNAIIEAGGKYRPPMLAPGNYVQWKSRIKRYIDTKPNSELIHYCLANPPHIFTWVEQISPVSEASSETHTEGIDNDIYSTVDACPNACEMWKVIERLKQGESINFLLQLQPEWKRFVTLVKQSQELKIVSYQKLYDILKQHQNKVNEIRAERLACTANPLALVAQQQPVSHPQPHPTHYTQNSSTKPQQAATRNRGKAIVNSPQPIYDQEPTMVAKDDEMSKEKEIDKLMALISLSFKKIYKPTNNNLRTSSNNNRGNQDNSPRTNRGTGYDNQRAVDVFGARETVEEAGIQLSAEQVDWRDDTDDEPDDQELEAHYLYMAQIQEVTLDVVDNSGPIFDAEPLQKDNQDDNDYLAKERDLLASLIEKLKCEIDDSKNRNKLLESSNKILVDKLTSQIEDFKNTNKNLESSNTYFKEANNELSKTNQLMFKDLKKFQDELICRRWSLNISDMKNELVAHQETISIMSQQKEDQKKFYKTRKEKELKNVIALENKIKVLDDIIYKTGQSVQTMNMLNRNCKTSFVKPEFLKKAQRANPRLYDTGCYNDNLALMLAPESDETIRLAQESRSKLSDLIKPFDYKNLNSLYDFFVPQREKLAEQRYFSERSKMSHTPVKNTYSTENFNKQTTLLEKRMDESTPWDKKCKSSQIFQTLKQNMTMIFNGVKCCKEIIHNKTWHGYIDPVISSTIETNFDPSIHKLMTNTERFFQSLKEEMVVDLKYFNSLENEIESLQSQLVTQRTQFLNEIDRLSREYYYADHMNAMSHPVSGGITGCDDTVHRTRYKIIHFTIYKNETWVYINFTS
ncbi:hypothetical protein Tco_1367807 [Tanacetum coccineum]